MSKPNLFNVEAIAAKLAETDNPLAQFQSVLRDSHTVLKDHFLTGTEITALVHQHTAVVDELLGHAWTKYFNSNDKGIALIAVGGYGRGELHPHSDIDLLILLKNNKHKTYKTQIEHFVTFLWDIGLKVGHSVRSIKECVSEAKKDITITTNLMESRLLIGPTKLFDIMHKKTGPKHIWPSQQFFEAKWTEQKNRHQKFDATTFKLEPNVKEGPGGLRDIQMIAWVTKRHFDASTLYDLVTHDFLTQPEYNALVKGQEFLWRIRFALHIQTNRCEDRLLFDYQSILAKQFAYQDDAHRLAVEKFMKDYYSTIMELNRLNEMLLQLFQELILFKDKSDKVQGINNRFQIKNGFIEVTDQNVFKRYPFALLEIFLLLELKPEIKGVRASTIRLIRDHRHLIDEKFRNDIRCRNVFMEILKQPNGITHELKRMNRYGILAEYFPAFGKIVGLMQYDLYHIYTVDEHTLTVLRNVRRFTVPEFASEFPHCSDIIRRIPKLEILYLGALFHDIAKGRGGDHSELGAEEAKAFCLHHGMGQYDSNIAAWLVKNHLIMSSTAQRKDIHDPDVITEFAAIVGDQTHLDYLYLLTVADIRATNPNLWNSWRDSLLFGLYTTTKRALRRGLENPIDKEEYISETQINAKTLLTNIIPIDEIDALWTQLDDEYFLRHSADEIAWHSQAIINSTESDLPLILIREKTQRGGTEIFLYTHDMDHLFAMSAMALDQMNLNILDARIITTDNRFTLDTFIVLDSSGKHITDPHRKQEIITTLKKRIEQQDLKTTKISRRPGRRLKHFNTSTQINFNTASNNRYTIMEIITSDRPGLLAHIGQALAKSGYKVQNAKIATAGERVEDVFFITDNKNQALTSEEQFNNLRNIITEHLDNEQSN